MPPRLLLKAASLRRVLETKHEGVGRIGLTWEHGWSRGLLYKAGSETHVGIWLVVIIIVAGLLLLFVLRLLWRRLLELLQWSRLKRARSFTEHPVSTPLSASAAGSSAKSVHATMTAVLNKSKSGGGSVPLSSQSPDSDVILDMQLGIRDDNSNHSRGLTTEVAPEPSEASREAPSSHPELPATAQAPEEHERAVRQCLRTRTRVLHAVSCSLGACGRGSVLGSPHSVPRTSFKRRHPHSPGATSEGAASPTGSIAAAEIDHFSMDSLPLPPSNSPFSRFQTSNALGLDPRRGSGSSTSSIRHTIRSKRSHSQPQLMTMPSQYISMSAQMMPSQLLSTSSLPEEGLGGEWLPMAGGAEGLEALERQLSRLTVQSGGGQSVQHTQSQVAASFEQFWLHRRRVYQRRELITTHSQLLDDLHTPPTHYYDIDNLLAQHRASANYPQMRSQASRSLHTQSIGSPSHSATLTPGPSSQCDPSLMSSVTSPRSSQFNTPRTYRTGSRVAAINPLHHVERHVPTMPAALSINPVPPSPQKVARSGVTTIVIHADATAVQPSNLMAMAAARPPTQDSFSLAHTDPTPVPGPHSSSAGDTSTSLPGAVPFPSLANAAAPSAVTSTHMQADHMPEVSRLVPHTAASATAAIDNPTSQDTHDDFPIAQPGSNTLAHALSATHDTSRPGSTCAQHRGVQAASQEVVISRAPPNPNPAIPALKLADLDFDLGCSGVLGKGANGCVFKGSYQGQAVAVKVVSLHAKHRQLMQLSKEAKVLSQVQHQHIVHLHGASLQHPWALLVEELMEFNLSDYIHRRGAGTRVALHEVVLMGKCIASALCALHPYIVHRDLKPQNVLLSHDGRVKLADFGLAFMMDTDQELQANFVAGTLPYIAPECFHGDDYRVTPKADIYSLGILLCECLSQQRPWMGLNKLAVAHQVVTKQARPRLPTQPHCPAALQALIEDCWHTDPHARPTAEQVYERLTQVEHYLKLTTV